MPATPRTTRAPAGIGPKRARPHAGSTAMTHHPPGRDAVPFPTDTIGRTDPTAAPVAPIRLDREVLRLGVALRREALARLQEEMVAACEAAAGLGDPRTCAPDDRASWDRGAWRRYLDEATRRESIHGPRMRRLREDIARLERLLDPPVAA